MSDATTDSAILNHLRLRLFLIREDKERQIAALRSNEIEEARIEKEFLTAFPGESRHGPAVPYDDLTPIERHVLNFIAVRGRVRRLASHLVAFQHASGVGMNLSAFRMHLSWLHEKGALARNGMGWSVEPTYLVRSLEVPPPIPAKMPKTGFAEVLSRARKTRAPVWASRAQIEAARGLPPALEELLNRFPPDRAVPLRDLIDTPSAKARVTANLKRLQSMGMIVRFGHGVYGRAGVDLPAVDPLPNRTRAALDVLPRQQAISLAEWAKRSTGSDSRDARAVTAARASVLVRRGMVQRIGRALYRRIGKVEVTAPEVQPPAKVVDDPSGLVDLPLALVAVLAQVPDRGEITLAELEVACDGDVAASRGRMSGHVYRLVQRGLLERTAARTYRRVAAEMAEEIGLLRHFSEGSTLRLAEIVVKEEGKVSGSGLGRVRGELERLVAERRLEKVGGGYKLAERMAMDRASRRAGART